MKNCGTGSGILDAIATGQKALNRVFVGQLIEVGAHAWNECLHSAGTDRRATPDRPNRTPYTCEKYSRAEAILHRQFATTTARPIQWDGSRQA